ncbi:cytochrome P450 [Mycena capillaripes]|nr:cytochrome P450 [Mycena capillaripes]
MHAILRLALPCFATAGAYILLQIAELIFRDLRSPLRNLLGPKNPSFLYGNTNELEDDPRITWTWRNTFGATFQFRSLFNTRELYTVDTVAIDHIVKNNYIYQKRAVAQGANNRLAGEGLLGVEGDAHKRQNPAFGTAQIRSLTEVFIEKSVEVLRDIWARKIGHSARIDVLDWLSKMTLDVIGQAGFDYHFDSMNAEGKPNDIHQLFNKLFHNPAPSRLGTIRAMQPTIPLLRFLPLPGRKVFSESRNKLFSLGNKILMEGKAAITAAGGPKAVFGSRDLFSLILRANLSADIPEDHRMSDSEVVGQIPTFFVAGHATTSSAIAWVLHALSVNQHAQAKLRAELLTLATKNPTLEELNSLPFLDSVVRETLRVHAPVSHITRIAAVDDILPLGTPIRKGQHVRIPISDVNTDITLWGNDAAEFRPERWEQVPKAAESIPGVWGNLMTFFGGPHNCIGFRFSLAEQKALLFVLIPAFEFEQAVPAGDIRRTSNGLQSPFVSSERETGSQMPLMVKTYTAKSCRLHFPELCGKLIMLFLSIEKEGDGSNDISGKSRA